MGKVRDGEKRVRRWRRRGAAPKSVRRDALLVPVDPVLRERARATRPGTTAARKRGARRRGPRPAGGGGGKQRRNQPAARQTGRARRRGRDDRERRGKHGHRPNGRERGSGKTRRNRKREEREGREETQRKEKEDGGTGHTRPHERRARRTTPGTRRIEAEPAARRDLRARRPGASGKAEREGRERGIKKKEKEKKKKKNKKGHLRHGGRPRALPLHGRDPVRDSGDGPAHLHRRRRTARGIAFIASWIPARRATRVDPRISLNTNQGERKITHTETRSGLYHSASPLEPSCRRDGRGAGEANRSWSRHPA